MPSNLLAHLELQTEDPFETVFAEAPILMQSIDAGGRLINVSRFLADFLGYEREEMIGRPSTDFLTEDSRRHAVETVLPRFFREGRADGVGCDYVRKNGDVVAMVMSATSQIDETGAFTRSLAVLYDNTEARRAHEMLARSQQLETIGQLDGGVAHDFNNILSVIAGNLHLLETASNPDERALLIKSANDAVGGGASLSRQLLTMGKQQALMPEPVSLDAVIDTFVVFCRNVFPATISVQFDHRTEPLRVFADPNLLQSTL